MPSVLRVGRERGVLLLPRPRRPPELRAPRAASCSSARARAASSAAGRCASRRRSTAACRSSCAAARATSCPRYRVAAKPYSVAGADARRERRASAPFGGDVRLRALRSAASESLVAARLAAEQLLHGHRRRSARRRAVDARIGLRARRSCRCSSTTSAAARSLASFVASEAIVAARLSRHPDRDLRRRLRLALAAVDAHRPRDVGPSHARVPRQRARCCARSIAANPSVTFKLMLDGPGSGAYIEALKSLREPPRRSRRPRRAGPDRVPLPAAEAHRPAT